MKGLFFTLLIGSCFVSYGLVLNSDENISSSTGNQISYQALNKQSTKEEKKDTEEESKNYKKLELLTNQDIVSQDDIEIPVIAEENEEEISDIQPIKEDVETNEEKVENTKKTLEDVSATINNTEDIDLIKEEGEKLLNLDTSYIDEVVQVNNDLEAVKQEYNNILIVDEFMKNANSNLKDNKSLENIQNVRNEIENKDILNIISNLSNEKIKAEYEAEYQDIKPVLSDTNAPTINIENNKTYNEDVNIEISDESATTVYLNNELFNGTTISENGSYQLKVIDNSLNETTVNFTIAKQVEEPAEPVVEQTPEEVPATTRYPMNNWYLTQDFSGKGGHMGIDMGSFNKSEEIYPIADGIVVHVGQDSHGANLVKILHEINGKQIFSTYAHMREVYFSPWQHVTKNDLLGLMGSTGYSTGPHLHLELTTCDYTYNCSYAEYKNSLINPWEILPS